MLGLLIKYCKKQTLKQIKMPGTLNHYKITKTIGVGGSCKVKLAEDTKTGRKVAIKLIKDDIDYDFKKQILAETQTMAKLDSEHVVK